MPETLDENARNHAPRNRRRSQSLNFMEQQIRTAARRCLPSPIRKPLGWLAGKFNETVLMPAQGFFFDLAGGRFQADGCTFTVPKDATTMGYRACFFRGNYELEERELIRRWIRPDDHVVELGACLGVVSCVTNKLLTDKTRHVVVEANPFCIPTIYRNRELNGSGFLVEHCAVGDGPEVTFYLHPIYIVGGTSQRPTSRPFRLPAKSLRRLDHERGPFSALVIDIEGSEREVFESSTDLLQKYRLVIAELHEWAIGTNGVERCRQILRDCGLQLVDRAGITEAWKRV
jgi:FkbM family methyltransferase